MRDMNNINKMGMHNNKEQFDQFEATALYCPKCKAALPVRKSLLLVLPNGEIYDYRCARCGTPVGTKTERKNIISRGSGYGTTK